jgi:hypothetical protein
MKKIMAIFISLLFLFSVFAVAESNMTEEEPPVPTLYDNLDDVACTEDAKECPDGSYVSRDPENGCEFYECPEEDIEEEAIEYEEEETGEEVIEEVEESLETDEEIEEELELTDEEKAEIEEAIEKIGLRLYVLNRQLKCRLRGRIAEGKAIIEFLDNKSIETTELQEIVDKLTEIYESIDPKTMTKEEHRETVKEVKELIQSFKEKAKELIPEEDISEIRILIKRHHNKVVKNCLRLEWKARQLHNRRKLRDSLNNIKEDAKKLREDGKKLLDAAKRLRHLQEIKEKYKKGEAEAKELIEEWKQGVKEYDLDKAASVVKNERALLVIEIARLKRAIREAEEEGDDTTELEEKLEALVEELKEFHPEKIKVEEAKAKAAVLKTRLENLAKEKKLKERIRKDPIEVRKAIATKVRKNIAKNRALKKAVTADQVEVEATEGDTE